MNISHIEHLGIAVKSLDEAIPYYENILGMKCYSIEEVADQKVKTAFFKVGQTKLELLEPTSDESPPRFCAVYVVSTGPMESAINQISKSSLSQIPHAAILSVPIVLILA